MFYRIAKDILDIPFNREGLATIRINDRNYCIANHKGKLHACNATCPHAGGKLSDGYIDALGNIVCPVHHYRFSLEHGRNTSGEGYQLKIFKVEEREDGVYIDI